MEAVGTLPQTTLEASSTVQPSPEPLMARVDLWRVSTRPAFLTGDRSGQGRVIGGGGDRVLSHVVEGARAVLGEGRAGRAERAVH